jgi:hypothetical protein
MKKILAILIWTSLVITVCLTVYVNYYLPRGQRYPTGDYVCQYDDRDRCAEEYKEDVRKLNIMLLLIGLLVAGILASAKINSEKKEGK